MQQVKFKWISRAKFNALTVKDDNTIYFIYNEHVLYKGSQEYGGIQSISYTVDSENNYVINITNGDGTVSTLQVASSSNNSRLESALDLLRIDVNNHIATLATEVNYGHTKITDTIESNNPKDVSDNTAVTPKAVVDYVSNTTAKILEKYPSRLNFPLVGKEDCLYLAQNTNYLWLYENGGYVLLSDNWKQIQKITGVSYIN